MSRSVLRVGLAGLFVFAGVDGVGADEPVTKSASVNSANAPLGNGVQRGLAYLVNQQHDNGGWGQGGGWRTGGNGRVEGDNVQDPPDVGNTAVAVLALVRAGNTPQRGSYADSVRRGMEFIVGQIETSDEYSLFVTTVRDTQLQSKIGRYVDTFLAAMVLSELKGHVGNETGEQRLAAALKKTIAKIERNQRQDGTFADNGGWAGVLSMGLCGKALRRAHQAGVEVRQETLQRDFDQALASLDAKKSAAATSAVVGSFKFSVRTSDGLISSPRSAAEAVGDAGIDLYSLSANNGRLHEQILVDAPLLRQARQTLSDAKSTDAEKQDAQSTIDRLEKSILKQQTAAKEVVEKMADPRFRAGFGNNGGEEFLSYMNLGEMLAAQGGEKWENWRNQISENLRGCQNQDGSWSGQHCITGRTFCTSAAILAVLADRAPFIRMADNSHQAR